MCGAEQRIRLVQANDGYGARNETAAFGGKLKVAAVGELGAETWTVMLPGLGALVEAGL